MKLTVSEWCAAAVVALNLAQIVWVQRQMRRAKMEEKAKAARVPREPGSWTRLESGWSIPLGDGAAAFIILLDGGAAYWWVKRAERTIVEGPADTFEVARTEVEKARREFLR